MAKNLRAGFRAKKRHIPQQFSAKYLAERERGLEKYRGIIDPKMLNKKMKNVDWFTKQITFYPHFGCNARCDICFTGSGPNERKTLPKSMMNRFVKDAKEVGFQKILVSGGEPTFNKKSLMNFADACKKSKMQFGIDTNAQFGKTKEEAMNLLHVLKQKGLDQILISADEYHQKFVPLKNVCNTILAAQELGIHITVASTQAGSFWYPYSIAQEFSEMGINASYNPQPISPSTRKETVNVDQDTFVVNGKPVETAFGVVQHGGRGRDIEDAFEPGIKSGGNLSITPDGIAFCPSIRFRETIHVSLKKLDPRKYSGNMIKRAFEIINTNQYTQIENRAKKEGCKACTRYGSLARKEDKSTDNQ